MEATAILENWHKVDVMDGEFIIYGQIFNDTRGRWPNGTPIHTSGIKNRKCKKDDIVITRNSTYKLGNELGK
jgi:hypothetical protein